MAPGEGDVGVPIAKANDTHPDVHDYYLDWEQGVGYACH